MPWGLKKWVRKRVPLLAPPGEQLARMLFDEWLVGSAEGSMLGGLDAVSGGGAEVVRYWDDVYQVACIHLALAKRRDEVPVIAEVADHFACLVKESTKTAEQAEWLARDVPAAYDSLVELLRLVSRGETLFFGWGSRALEGTGIELPSPVLYTTWAALLLNNLEHLEKVLESMPERYGGTG